MSSYKGQNLFGSGPHYFVARGLTMRHDEQTSPGADGAVITTLGWDARRIDQRGMLLADDMAGLQAQIQRIESAMDGVPGVLVDELGQSHKQMVLLQFHPAPASEKVRRVGVRLSVNYTAWYLQDRKSVV